MGLKKAKFIPLFFFLIYFIPTTNAQQSLSERDKELLENGIGILKKYFIENNYWYASTPKLKEDVKGLIHFIEDEPIDSILISIDTFTTDSSVRFVSRLPEYVSDSLKVPGYYPKRKLQTDLDKIGINLQSEFQTRKINLPPERLAKMYEDVQPVPPGEGMSLFKDSVYKMPGYLIIPAVIPDSMLEDADNFNRLIQLDSLRTEYVEKKRLEYNDSLLTHYRDSVAANYRKELFEAEYNQKKNQLIDSVELNNYRVLKNYNDSVMQAVNDSIYSVIKVLAKYADYIDTTAIEIRNLYNESSEIRLSNQDITYKHFWLKNEQNDSLRLLIKNLDKRTLQFTIDDGVTFSRFRPKETKDFDFSSLRSQLNDLTGVGKRYEVETPWTITGDGTVGFTQTYIGKYWKKGGQSSLSLLIVLKGAANYSRADGKVKWENSAEIRDGWIYQGGEGSELQKNDDRLEFTSRFGVSAFKKWYYSTELNFETQFFRGYKYPKKDFPDPISAFMAPAKTFFKLGLDYKPNKEFSLLLSPLTIKNVYVRDTMLIDQTKFSIEKGRKSFWEPGLNADVTIKKEIFKDIVYETKYKMFINYQSPFKKFDVNWENLLVMKLNDHVNMRFMLHMIYDDDVLFPIYDENDVKIGEEPRLQLKQFISVSFSYTINHKVLRTKRIR